MNAPRISIIIPTYNRRELLQQTLNSVQQQTCPNWEAIIVDDGSDDGTLELLKQQSDKDSRIRYVRLPQGGLGASACRNQGTAIAQGDYIIYLDSDDCLAPSALENRYRLMEEHPRLDFGVFPCMVFHQQPGDTHLLWNIETEMNDLDRFLARDVPWQTTSPIWRKTGLKKVGGWDENRPSWNDWEYHIRALILNLNYCWFPYPDCYWRKPQSKSLGVQSISPEHLKSHEACLQDIQNLLIQTEQLTQRRNVLLRIQYFWLAESWLTHENLSESLQIWQRCFQQKLVNQSLYILGINALKLMYYSPDMIQKITQKLIHKIGPKSLIFQRSMTLRQVEIPECYQVPVLFVSTV